MKTREIFNGIQAYAIMFVGLTLYALGWILFLIPAGINGGGVSGIGALVFYATGIPMGIPYLIINAILILFAIKILGKGFGTKTIINIVINSVLLTVLQGLIKEPIIDDNFLSAVLGGILGGVGLGLVFTQGGSTGGTDIIAMIIGKYRRVSPGRVIMYCDVFIIASSWFVFQSIEKIVYGYVSMWVVAYTLDAFLNGANQSTQIFIFSEKWEAIRDVILHDRGRGVTIIDGTGGYTNNPVKIVMTVVKKRESASLFKSIKHIDDNAFISMGNVMGVYGQGFDQLKP